MSTVAFLTDFGESDWFVGTMKGVVRSIAPDAALVDITHNIKPFEIQEGAFALFSSYSHFPAGTIFCCVVDPGVGTDRHAICATDGRYYFVAPDNGLLSFVCRQAGDNWRVYKAENTEYIQKNISYTFHGRDVFAPLAAHLIKGVSPEKLGPELKHIKTLEASEPYINQEGMLEGEVIYIDRFGNLISNITNAQVREHFADLVGQEDHWHVKIRNLLLPGLSLMFSDKQPEEFLFYWGSSDFLEIAINQGNAAEVLDVEVGVRVVLYINALEKPPGHHNSLKSLK